MTIPDIILCLAIAKTTGHEHKEAPNTYRILSWLYGCELIDGQLTAFDSPSTDFEQVASYLLEHYDIKTIPTRQTGAAYEPVHTEEHKASHPHLFGHRPKQRLAPQEVEKYRQLILKGALTTHDREP